MKYTYEEIVYVFEPPPVYVAHDKHTDLNKALPSTGLRRVTVTIMKGNNT